MLAQDNYLCLWDSARDFPGGLQTVEIGHTDVHENKIGTQKFCLLDGVATVDRLAADVYILLGSEERAHTLSDYFMVIGYEHPHSELPLTAPSNRLHLPPSSQATTLFSVALSPV